MKSILALHILVAVLPAAIGASFSLNPTADAFVTTGPSGNLAGNNYGGAGALAVSAPGLSQGGLQSVLQFNLAAAIASFDSTYGAGLWSIQSATLQLSAASANNPIFNPSAPGQFGISWMQNDSWTEGTGSPLLPGADGITSLSLQNTFIGAGDESLGTFGFNGANSGAFTYELGLTPGFTTDLRSGENLSLRVFAADNSVSGVFNSRSFPTVANRPMLTIVAVPEPGTFALAGLGLALCVGWRCARKRK